MSIFDRVTLLNEPFVPDANGDLEISVAVGHQQYVQRVNNMFDDHPQGTSEILTADRIGDLLVSLEKGDLKDVGCNQIEKFRGSATLALEGLVSTTQPFGSANATTIVGTMRGENDLVAVAFSLYDTQDGLPCIVLSAASAPLVSPLGKFGMPVTPSVEKYEQAMESSGIEGAKATMVYAPRIQRTLHSYLVAAWCSDRFQEVDLDLNNKIQDDYIRQMQMPLLASKVTFEDVNVGQDNCCVTTAVYFPNQWGWSQRENNLRSYAFSLKGGPSVTLSTKNELPEGIF